MAQYPHNGHSPVVLQSSVPQPLAPGMNPTATIVLPPNQQIAVPQTPMATVAVPGTQTNPQAQGQAPPVKISSGFVISHSSNNLRTNGSAIIEIDESQESGPVRSAHSRPRGLPHALPQLLADDYNPHKVNELLQQLFKASSMHETALNKKTEMLAQAQTLSSTLWSFHNQQKVASATCMCPNPVSYSYPEQVAHFSEPNSSRFLALIGNLNQFNSRALWLSLFEQASAELELVKYVHSLLHNNTDTSSLRHLLDSISALLGPPASRENFDGLVSWQSIAVLRGLFIVIGTYLLNQSSISPGAPASSVQSLLDDSPASPLAHTMTLRVSYGDSPELSTSDLSNPSFLLDKSLQVLSLGWAGQLLQPSLDDIIKQNWLSRATDEKLNLLQVDYIRILCQVPWNQIGKLTLDQIKQSILLPFQKLLQIGATKSFVVLLVLIGKIIAIISRLFPDLTLSCVGVLMRSAWPSKMVSTVVFKLMSWDSLAMSDITVLVGELYQLFQRKPLEYSQLQPPQRHEHRDTFSNYLLANQQFVATIYRADATIAAKNGNLAFPLISTMTELALAFIRLKKSASASPDLLASSSASVISGGQPDIAKLLTEELTFMAFVWLPPSNYQSLGIVPFFKRETTTAVRSYRSLPRLSFALTLFQQLMQLVVADPSLFSVIVAEIGTLLPQVNIVDYITFLRSVDTSLWPADETTLTWIAFLLARRNLPALPAPNSPQYGASLESLVSAFYHGPPHIKLTPQVSKLAIDLGTNIVDSISWQHASPMARTKLVVVLLASAEHTTPAWRCRAFGYLLTPQTLIDLDPMLAERVLRLEPRNDPLVAISQGCVSASFSLAYYQRVKENGGAAPADAPVRDLKWLIDLGIMRRLQTTTADYHDLSCLASSMIFKVVKNDPLKDSFVHVQGLIDGLQRVHLPNTRRWLTAELIKSLSNSAEYGPWITFWAFLLIPKLELRQASAASSFTVSAYDAALNELVHGLFCGVTDFEELSHLVKQKVFSMRDLEKYLNNNLPWVVYLGIWAFVPRIPPAIDSSMREPDHTIKESALWFWREAAMRIANPRLAMVFWERFFQTYFESEAMHATKEYFPITWKDSLNKHFTSLAQQFHAGADNQPLYKVYYSFTTWSKEIIFTAGSSVFQSADNSILKAFIKHFPPRFPETLAGLQAQTTNYPSAADSIVASQQSRPRIIVNLPRIDEKDNLEQLLSLLPAKLDGKVSNSFFESDEARFKDFCEEFNQTFSALTLRASQPPSTLPLGLTTQIRTHLEQYRDLGAFLERLDRDHHTLLRSLYRNESVTYSIKVACQEGRNCAGPVALRLNSSRVVTADINGELKKNRDKFNEVYFNFFQVARSVAHFTSLLQSLSTRLLSEDSPQNQAMGRDLFFELAALIIEGLPPVYSPVTSQMVTICMNLGSKYIYAHADDSQERLLRLILTKAKEQSLGVIVLPTKLPSASSLPSLSASSLLLEVSPLVSALDVSYPTATTVQAPQTTPKSAQQMHLESLAPSSASLATSGPLPGSSPFSLVDSVLKTVRETGGLSTFAAASGTQAPTSPAGIMFDQTRANLYMLLSPACFIANGNFGSYLDLLVSFASSTSALSSAEEKILADQFDLPNTLHTILQSQHSERLYQVLEVSLAKKSLATLNDLLLPALMKHNYPDNAGRVARIALLQPAEAYLPNWDLFDVSSLHESILPVILSEVPLPHVQMQSAIRLTRRVILHSDYKDFLANEVVTSFEAESRIVPSERWSFISSLFATALNSPDSDRHSPSQVSLQNFYAIIELLVEIVYATHLVLVDRFWYLYLSTLVPYIADHASTIDFGRLEEIFRRLPWYQATFHYSDPSAVVEMASLPEVHGPIQRLIFTQLDWINFADFIHNPGQLATASAAAQAAPVGGDLLVDFGGPVAQPKPSPPIPKPSAMGEFSYRQKGILHFLKLFFETNVDTPEAIPGALRSRVLSISEDPNEWYKEGRHLFLWQKLPAEDFVDLFTTDAILLKAVAKASKATTDPTKHVMENILLLRDVARTAGSPEAIVFVLKDIRKLLFVCLSSMEKKNHYWYLPAQQHIDIVNTVIIPLVQQFHNQQLQQHDSDERSPRLYTQVQYEPLAVLFSCTKGIPGVNSSWDWGQPYLAPIKFWNSKTMPKVVASVGQGHSDEQPPELIGPKKDQQKQLHQLNSILYGLISRFCLSADPELCLAILNQAHKGINHDLRIVMHVFEETLHSFFNQTTLPRALSIAAAATFIPFGPTVPWASVVKACFECKTPLSLRVLLEQHRQQFANAPPQQWQASIEATIPIVYRFQPKAHHEFDIISLWFYVIEIMADPRWTLSLPATQSRYNEILLHWQTWAGDALSFAQTFFTNEHMYIPDSPEPNMQLAARACGLFLRRMLQSRDRQFTTGAAGGTGALRPVDLSSELDKFLALKSNPKYSRYSNFFSQMDAFLSPIFDISSFQVAVVNSLAPIAPYLLQFVVPPAAEPKPPPVGGRRSPAATPPQLGADEPDEEPQASAGIRLLTD